MIERRFKKGDCVLVKMDVVEVDREEGEYTVGLEHINEVALTETGIWYLENDVLPVDAAVESLNKENAKLRANVANLLNAIHLAEDFLRSWDEGG